MTVPATFLNVEKYNGNNAARTFSFSFWSFGKEDIVVSRADPGGNEVILTLGTDYSIAFNQKNLGGTVTLNTVLQSGYTLAISRSTPINQELDLVNQGAFYAEDHEAAFDKLTAICQELKEVLGRCLIVPITSTKTPQEVLNDLLEISAKATEYAQKAEIIYNEVKNTELYVSATWQEIQEAKAHIDIYKAAVDAALARAEEILARSEVIGQEVDALVPHLPDLQINRLHIDEIHRVGSDLRGFETETLDLGSITDTEIDGETRVTEGYIKKVADHIDDCIHPVGENIEKVADLHNNMEDIQTVASDLQGLSSPTLDLGSITEEAENMPTVEGGYLKTLAGISADIAALGPKADDIATVKDNLPTVTTVSQSITSVTTVSENIEKVVAVEDKLDAIGTVVENLETVESAASVAENLESIKQTVLEANASAGFSFRYMAGAEGSLTVDLESITPSVNIKAGDHVVNAWGDYFEITEIDSEAQTATLSLKRGSFKGEKGDKGDGLHVAGVYPTYEALSATEGESGKIYLAGLDLYMWSPSWTESVGKTDEETGEPVLGEDGSQIMEEVVHPGSWINAGQIVGPKGDTGETPIISVAANQLPEGSLPKVTKTGTNKAPVLTFGIPKGDTGPTGPTPVVSIEVQILSADAEPSVEKTGTDEAPSFLLKIPRGLTGDQGPIGDMPEVVDLGGLS